MFGKSLQWVCSQVLGISCGGKAAKTSSCGGEHSLKSTNWMRRPHKYPYCRLNIQLWRRACVQKFKICNMHISAKTSRCGSEHSPELHTLLWLNYRLACFSNLPQQLFYWYRGEIMVGTVSKMVFLHIQGLHGFPCSSRLVCVIRCVLGSTWHANVASLEVKLFDQDIDVLNF